jgi:hypothetical protein
MRRILTVSDARCAGHFVVAINDDTLYASVFATVGDQPLVVTIPTTSVTYSILALDAYGDIFETGIAPGTPGTFALTGPGWTGTLPPGVTPFPVPVKFFLSIFRADKFSASGKDQTKQAELFRESLKAQALSDYVADPSGGRTKIFPEIAFSPSFKHNRLALPTSLPSSASSNAFLRHQRLRSLMSW